MTPLQQLVKDAIEWANWCAGQGVRCVDPEAPHVNDPEDFLLKYSMATGDGDRETLATRVAVSDGFVMVPRELLRKVLDTALGNSFRVAAEYNSTPEHDEESNAEQAAIEELLYAAGLGPTEVADT